MLPDAISSIYTSSKQRTNSMLDIFIISQDERIYKDGEEFISEINIDISTPGHNNTIERIKRDYYTYLNC